MKSKRVIVLLLLMVVFYADISAKELIYLFKSDIEVLESSDLIITETIKVRAEGNNIQRGIYRAIPNTYKTKSGAKFKVKYDIVEVLRDGKPENFHIKNENGYSKIYLGEKKYFLPVGDYEYTLKYKTNKQIGYFKDFDEIYWNVNGVEWNFTIQKIEAIVKLPKTAKIGNFKAYTGAWGEKNKDFKVTKISDNIIKFESTKIFNPNENMSIAVAWQKGIVKEPSREEKIINFFQDNMILIIGLLGVLLTVLVHLVNWKKVGEDPPTGTIIPQFTPPDNLSPSAMRYILKMNVDNKGFTSAIVSMATKGFLTIIKHHKIYHLQKLDAPKNVLKTKSEEAIINTLFKNKSKFKLSDTNHSTISSALDNFKNAEKEMHKETYFKLNRKYLIAGMVLSVVTLLAMFFLRGVKLNIVSLFQFFPFIVFLFITFKNATSFLKNIFGIVVSAVILLVFFVFSSSSNANLSGFETVVLISVIIILIAINLLFAYLMKAPTMFGRKEMDKVEGFKMYLKTAEEDRLDSLNIPNKTPELFEKYLPYAIALDCENQWAKKFKSIIEEAINAGTYSQPSWYVGRRRIFNPNTFTNDIGRSFNNAVTESSISPSQRSSGSGGGFSGGGFSGGGGGGGGGGGW